MPNVPFSLLLSTPLARPRAEMTTTDDNGYTPSASERVRDQVARYEASDGSDGGDLGGRPVIRKTPIMRVVDGDTYVAIASYAGNPHDPAWYRNLVAYPEAEVRDRAQRIRVRAREVQGEEKVRLWAIADAGNPAYADYRAKAGRDIPILVLEPMSS
jgi:deazaflavin-dependent oxidoreductase (nitroreductase family)